MTLDVDIQGEEDALKLFERMLEEGLDLSEITEACLALTEDFEDLENEVKYKATPVGAREFIESPSYMNAGKVVWESCMDEIEEMSSGRYVECVLTGAIGTAKTTIALYVQAYQLYLLSLLTDPHEEFDLDPASEIMVIFQSINANVAKDVAYSRFRNMILASPYFKRHFMFREDLVSEMRFPKNIIYKPVSGADTAAIGQNVIGALIDEVNFMEVIQNSKKSKDGEVYDQAVKIYTSIARRRESRFMKKGFLPGMVCLMSSRNYPGQFTDKKEKEALTNPRIRIYDKRLWELRPERFSGETFWIFCGDQTRKPRMLSNSEAEEMIAAADKKGEKSFVMAVPVEYQKTFEDDMMGSLRDIAGVATQALHPFIIDTDKIAPCFGKTPSVLSRDSCDFVNTKIHVFPNRFTNLHCPRFVHIDLALTGDSAGVSCGYIRRFVKVQRSAIEVEILPEFVFDFCLEVKPPIGGEIEFAKIRELLYVCKKLKLPIRWVTLDSFQSTDTKQILASKGFNTGTKSCDTDMAPYNILKASVIDGRLLAPESVKAVKEIGQLEKISQINKVDHPPNGSKDVSDSIAGVVFGLFVQQEIWLDHGITPSMIAKMGETYAAAKSPV